MDVQKLKEAAGAVLGWSNCDKAWLDTSEDESAAVFGHIDEDGNTYPVATIDCDQYYQGQDSLKLARFYAAANPAKVLDLITEIEQLRAENAALKKDANRLQVLLQKIYIDNEQKILRISDLFLRRFDNESVQEMILRELDEAVKGK